MNNPAAWHPDPVGAHEYRWWDGTRWTEHVADGGQASTDPLPGGPEADSQAAHGSTAPAGDATRQTDPGTSQGSPDADTAGAWHQPEADPAETAAQQPAQRWQDSGDGAQQPGGGAPQWSQEGPAWTSSPEQPAWTGTAGGPNTGGQNAGGGPNGLAIASLVIGILSLLFAFLPLIGLLGGLGGILALILGFVSRSRSRSDGSGGRGLAIAGIVTGIGAVIVSIAMTVGVFVLGGGIIETYTQCIEEGGTAEVCQEELNDDVMRRFGG